MSSAAAPKWFDALPAPRSSPRRLRPEELRDLLSADGHERVLVVDVRRADIEAPQCFMLPSAINCPAQTFYQTLPVLLPIFRRYDHVVFHCSSSQGRGPRCASWYQDALEERNLANNAYVLSGGVKAWVERYPESVIQI